MPENLPELSYLGGFTPSDGTIEFYGRIKALIRPDHTILDFGAGRGGWFEDESCEYRRDLRLLKGHVREVIAADVDPAVLSNRSSDRNLIIDGRVPLPDHSVDVIIADYVLEHVLNPADFVAEVRRLIKPGGVFCARTPHKYCYVSIGARLTRNKDHARILKWLQPGRKAEDIFPTAFRLNTLRDIRANFPDFQDFSYLMRCDPDYFGGIALAYSLLEGVHHLTPKWFSSNLFVFLKRL